MPIRVVLAEDHPQIRAFITHLLSQHCNVVQTVDRGEVVVSAVADHWPDAVVLDISMPGRNGFQVLRELRSRFPHLAIVLLSSHDAAAYREAALERRADAFVAKSDATKQLWNSVEAAVTQRRNLQVAESAARKTG